MADNTVLAFKRYDYSATLLIDLAELQEWQTLSSDVAKSVMVPTATSFQCTGFVFLIF